MLDEELPSRTRLSAPESDDPAVENTNLLGFESLVTPVDVKQALPALPRVEQLVLDTRRELRALIHGDDASRLLVVVGPCSIHDPKAALEYAQRLVVLKRELSDVMLILMRAYFEKPRTTLGWKGLINDPHLDGSCDISTGVQRARETLLSINALGMPCGSEMLDPITPQYVADLISWASIGARTTESQTHREMASGLSMPVGFKNGTDGSLDAACNALISAGHPHSFLGINAEGVTSVVKTRGNPDRHVVLRGGAAPNYSRQDVLRLADRVWQADAAIRRPIMVDASHGNSSKDYTRQPEVCRSVVGEMKSSGDPVMGLLIESNLEPGRQNWQRGVPLEYGKSITDGCIGWDATVDVLRTLADAVGQRRVKLSDEA